MVSPGFSSQMSSLITHANLCPLYNFNHHARDHFFYSSPELCSKRSHFQVRVPRRARVKAAKYVNTYMCIVQPLKIWANIFDSFSLILPSIEIHIFQEVPSVNCYKMHKCKILKGGDINFSRLQGWVITVTLSYKIQASIINHVLKSGLKFLHM